MSEEQNNPTDTDQAQGAETATPSEGPKYLTHDDLKQFGDSMFANMRRLVEGVAKPKNGKADAPAKSQTEAAPAVDVHAVIRREQEISESIAEQGHLTKEQRALLRKLVDVDKPDDVAGFIANHAKAFGRPSGEGTQPASTRAAGNPGRPVSDAGAPAAPPKFTDDTPLWKLAPEDRDRLIKEKGLAWYSNTLRKQAKGVRFRLR